MVSANAPTSSHQICPHLPAGNSGVASIALLEQSLLTSFCERQTLTEEAVKMQCRHLPLHPRGRVCGPEGLSNGIWNWPLSSESSRAAEHRVCTCPLAAERREAAQALGRSSREQRMARWSGVPEPDSCMVAGRSERARKAVQELTFLPGSGLDGETVLLLQATVTSLNQQNPVSSLHPAAQLAGDVTPPLLGSGSHAQVPGCRGIQSHWGSLGPS